MIKLMERNNITKQALVDFMDAETSDDACLKLIENMERIQNFSADFVEKAQKAFPRLDAYTSFPETEKMLFDLFIEEKILSDKVGGTLAYIMANLISYDPDKMTLTYSVSPTADPMNNGNADSFEPQEKLISDLENRLMKELGLLGDIYPEYKDWKFHEAYELVKVGKEMHDLKKTTTESRYAEIKALSGIYAEIVSGHKKIMRHQKDIKKIMENAAHGKTPSESSMLDNFLNDYNMFCKVKVRLSPEGCVFNEMTFPGEEDFTALNISEGSENAAWFEPYRLTTIFYLVEWFRSRRIMPEHAM